MSTVLDVNDRELRSVQSTLKARYGQDAGVQLAKAHMRVAGPGIAKSMAGAISWSSKPTPSVIVVSPSTDCTNSLAGALKNTTI